MRIATGSRVRSAGRIDFGAGVWGSAMTCVCLVVALCITSPVAAAATWSTQSLPASWSAPGGVSCTSSSACTAVGSFSGKPGHEVTLAARWDGKRWSRQPTPSPAGGASLLAGVSCTSRTACIAVGSCYCSGVHKPVVERWNGRDWSMQQIPYRAGADAGLNAVSCTSSSSCTAVGSTATQGLEPDVLVQRWNGRSWSVQTAPIPVRAAGGVLFGVSCVSLTFCTVVGMSIGGPGGVFTRPLIERWDGRRWAIDRLRPLPNSTSTELNSVSCTSATACTAVGQDDGGALVERWSGSRWSIQAAPDEQSAFSNTLSGVSCASATNCVAVGGSNLDASGSAAPPPAMVAERWNGRRWSLEHVPASPEGSWLNAVACPSTHACIAVGAINGAAVVERYS